MENVKALTKEEIGRKLARVNKDIMEISEKINKSLAIPMLLCLEEVVENSQLDGVKQNQFVKDIPSSQKIYPLINLFFARIYQQINDSIVSILDKGHISSKKNTKLPDLLFATSINQNVSDYIQELVNQGKIKEKDLYSFSELSLFQYQIGYVIILKNGYGKTKDSFGKIITLLDMFSKKIQLEDMLRSSKKKKTSSDEKIESAIKFLETNTFVPDWNSDFREAWSETLNSALVKGDENISFLKKENEEFFNAYNEMLNFSKTFNQEFGIDYNCFSSIISYISSLCYENLHNVGIWDSITLFEKVKENTKFQKKDFNKIIKLLSEFFELKRSHSVIIILNNKIITNFHRLNVAKLVLSEYCFDVAYRAELKGPSFEEGIRQLMRDKGVITLPKQVDIQEYMLPPNISDKLWGRKKKGSDFDVISCSNNKIFLIEGKERSGKRKSKGIERLKRKYFKKYIIEHFYKTKWVSENIELFEKYIGGTLTDIFSVDKKEIFYLFPLIVTNKPLDLEDNTTPQITYLELKEIDFTKDLKIECSNKSSGYLEIQILGRKTFFPWFSVIPLSN